MKLKYTVAMGVTLLVLGFGVDFILHDLSMPLRTLALALVGAMVASGYIYLQKRGSR